MLLSGSAYLRAECWPSQPYTGLPINYIFSAAGQLHDYEIQVAVSNNLWSLDVFDTPRTDISTHFLRNLLHWLHTYIYISVLDTSENLYICSYLNPNHLYSTVLVAMVDGVIGSTLSWNSWNDSHALPLWSSLTDLWVRPPEERERLNS